MLSTQAARVRYNGNGTTLFFSVPFDFFKVGSTSDIRVVLRDADDLETVLVENTDYVAFPFSTSITMTVAPAIGEVLAIMRNVDVSQQADYVPNDPFPADSHEHALDKLTMLASQFIDAAARAPSLADTDPLTGGTYRANQNRITDLADPEDDTDAATKVWVLAQISSPVGWTPDMGIAQFNANKLYGYPIANVAPTDGYVLTWDETSGWWEPRANGAELLPGVKYAGTSYGGDTTIQAAIDAAGAEGAVLIPSDYSGSDTYLNTSDIQILDMRRVGTAPASFGVWSIIAPALGNENYPAGSDLVMRTYGPADMYLEQMLVSCLGATNLIIGTNASVAVGAVTINNVNRGAIKTGTTALLSENAGIHIGRGTANAEIVNSGNWSIVNGTTLAMTCVNTHTAPYDIEQIGGMAIEATQLTIAAGGLQPASLSAYKIPLAIKAGLSDTDLLFLPSDTATTWPYSGIQFNALITGCNGSDNDLLIRMNKSASEIHVLNAANTLTLLSLDDSGNLVLKGNITGDADIIVTNNITPVNNDHSNIGAVGDAFKKGWFVDLAFGSKTGTGDVAVDGYVATFDVLGNPIKLATVA